jgi:fructose-1-phosphate kinase PfkB-like protein
MHLERGAGHGIFLIKASLRELEDLAGASIQSENAQERAARAIVAQGLAEIFMFRSARKAHCSRQRRACGALRPFRSRG